MTDRDALYRAVLADPDDDTPRLVYADWLDENDHPEEAEFVRVGCRLETEPPDHPDYPALLARRDELACWLGTHAPGPEPKFPAQVGVPGGRGWWESSRRGFPRFVVFEPEGRTELGLARSAAAAVEKAFAAVPTRWLVVTHPTPPQLAELLRQPVAERLSDLTVQLGADYEGDDEAAELVAGSPQLRNLRGLALECDVGEAAATALARSEHLGRLEWLSLPGRLLTPAAVRSLNAAAWFRGLRKLSINSDFTNEAFDELCRSGPFPRLHTLDLCESSFASWDAFARSGAFPALVRLELRHSSLASGAAGTLFGAKWLRPAYLDLLVCAMGNDGAEALARAPWLAGVRWLNLNWNLLSARGVAAVAGSPNLAALRHLDLSNNSLGASGLRAVAKNPALRGLLGLRLRTGNQANRLTTEHFREFLSELDMPNLRHLDLYRQPVGGRAARLLADPRFSSLTRLDLAEGRLTDAAVSELLAAPALQNLIELNLHFNHLKSAPEALADRRVLPRLASCSLMYTRLGDAAKQKLARRPGIVVS